MTKAEREMLLFLADLAERDLFAKTFDVWRKHLIDALGRWAEAGGDPAAMRAEIESTASAMRQIVELARQ